MGFFTTDWLFCSNPKNFYDYGCAIHDTDGAYCGIPVHLNIVYRVNNVCGLMRTPWIHGIALLANTLLRDNIKGLSVDLTNSKDSKTQVHAILNVQMDWNSTVKTHFVIMGSIRSCDFSGTITMQLGSQVQVGSVGIYGTYGISITRHAN